MTSISPDRRYDPAFAATEVVKLARVLSAAGLGVITLEWRSAVWTYEDGEPSIGHIPGVIAHIRPGGSGTAVAAVIDTLGLTTEGHGSDGGCWYYTGERDGLRTQVVTSERIPAQVTS